MTNSMIRRNGTVPAKPVSGWVDMLLNENMNQIFNDELFGLNGSKQSVNVPVNLRETDKSYELELVAPGLTKEDLKLNVSNNQLIISFEQKNENNQDNRSEGWIRNEYNMQSFSRIFTLDDSVDVNKIDAAYNNGILEVTLPKKEAAQRISKTIQVK
ncbi:MAG: Hsp20/alpha crystallin family protein [Chitinophagaceae bacterium]